MYSTEASEVKCESCGAKPQFEVSMKAIDMDRQLFDSKWHVRCPNYCISTVVYEDGKSAADAWIRINSPTGY